MTNQTTKAPIEVGMKVWDFATSAWATVVKVEMYYEAEEDRDFTFYILDKVKHTKEYPTNSRNRFEIGLSPQDEHGTIYTPETKVKIDKKGEIKIKRAK